MPCNDSILICQTLNLLSASLKPYVDENAIPGEAQGLIQLEQRARTPTDASSVGASCGASEACWSRRTAKCLLAQLSRAPSMLRIWAKFQEILEENKHKDVEVSLSFASAAPGRNSAL